MTSVFRTLQDFWNKLVRANQAAKEPTVESSSTGSSSHWSAVANARVRQTQRNLNRAYQTRVANTRRMFPNYGTGDRPSRSVFIQYPPWTSPTTRQPPRDEVTVTSPPPIEDKVTVTSRQPTMRTDDSSIPELEEEDKLQPKYRASPELRLLPDQIDRVKQTYYQDLNTTKNFNNKLYRFEIDVGKPVFYDERGDVSVFTSKPTNYQLFTFETSSGVLDTIILPVKDDGTIDTVPARRFLLENKLVEEDINEFLTKVKPVLGFAGLTDLIIPKEVPQLPLTVGVLDKGKPIYFNPLLNEISTDPSLWKLKVSEDTSQPFEVVPVSDDSPAYIVDDNTQKAVEEFVGDIHRMNTSFEYLKEWDTPEDAFSVPAKQSVDTGEALTPYNPLNILDQKPEEASVEIYTKEGQLQPLSLERQESASNFVSKVGNWLFQALILAGDLPERLFNSDTNVAGQRAKANFFTTISDALGTGLGQGWRNFISFLGKAYRDLDIKRRKFLYDTAISLLEGVVEDEKEDTFAGTLLRGAKLRSLELNKEVEAVNEFVDRMAVLNEYDAVRQGIRRIQALNDKVTFNQAMDYYKSFTSEFPEEFFENLEVKRDWTGAVLVKRSDGKFVPAKDFFKKSDVYRNLVSEFGQAYADNLIGLFFQYPQVREDLLLALKMRDNLISGMNELHNASILVSDLAARSSLRVVDYYNLISNPDYLGRALQDLVNGETTDVSVSVIQSLVNRSVLSGQEFSQDQLNEILEFLYADEGGQITSWKHFDVANRLSRLENPTINDLYLIVRQLDPLYAVYSNLSAAPQRRNQFDYSLIFPSDFEGSTLDEYFSNLQNQSAEVYQNLKSYIVNVNEVAKTYRDLGDLEKFESLSKTSHDILLGSVQFDRLARVVTGSAFQDVYASWSWDVTPDRNWLFLNNVVNAEMQLGRPLTPHEITQIRDNTIDVNYVLVGQMFADIMNIFDFIQAGKLVSFSVKGLGKILNTVPFIRTTTETVAKSKFVRFFTDLSIRSAVQKASYEVGEFLVRSMGDNLFEKLAPDSSVYKISDILSQAVRALILARKQAQSLELTDDVIEEAYFLFRNSKQALKNFPSHLSEQSIKKFLRSLDVFVSGELKNLLKDDFFSGLDDIDDVVDIASSSVSKNLDEAIEKTFSQYEEEIQRVVDGILRKGKWQKNFEESIRRSIAKTNKISIRDVTDDMVRNRVLEMADTTRKFGGGFLGYEEVLRSILISTVKEQTSKNRMFVHFLFSTSDTFVRYGRNLNRAWGGTTLLWDSFLGTMGRKIPIAKPVFRLVGEAWNLFMGLWVTATLARRPAWVIFNQMENLFRFVTLSMFNPTEYKQMIYGLIPDKSRAKILDELGVVPSGIGIDFIPIQTVVDDERFVRFFSGVSIASLSENPFKFFSSHYKQNLAEILEQARRDESLLVKILAPYTAFVSSVQSFNQVIEYGMRLRVYHTLLKRQLSHSIPILLRVFQSDVNSTINQFRENLRNDLLAKGASKSAIREIEQQFDKLISSYVSLLVEAIENNISDPFRVLSLISEQSSERLRGFITSFASSSYKFDTSFYNKTRTLINSNAEVTNINVILEILSSRIQQVLVESGKPLTPQLLDDIFALVRSDLENAYSQMYNYKIRTLFYEAAEEAKEKFKKSSDTSGFEEDPEVPPDTPPKPKGTPKKTKETDLGEEEVSSQVGSDYTEDVLKPSSSGENVLIVEFPQELSGKNSRNPLYKAWKNLNNSIQMATDAAERGEDTVLNKLIGSIRRAFNFGFGKAEPQDVKTSGVPVVEAGGGRKLEPQDLRAEMMEKARQEFEEQLIARMSRNVNEYIIQTFSDFPDIENFTKWSLSEQMKFYRENVITPLYASAMRRFLEDPQSLAGDEMFYGILSTALYDMSLGVWNRTALDTYVKYMLQSDATLAMVDMRGLHATNNLDVKIGDAVFSGYIVGDAYIKFIADALKKNSMNVPVFRQGGDEFVLVFPKDTNPDEIKAVMDKLADEISNTPVVADFQLKKPTGEIESVQVSFSGAKIHYGIGSDFDEASRNQNAAKELWLGGRNADEVRESYHLVPSEEQQSGLKVSVTKKGKKSDQNSEIERLNKRISDLEREVAELRRATSPSLSEDFMKRMEDTLNRQNEILAELSKQIKEGNIVVVNSSGKSDVQILGRVDRGDAGSVANTADEVLKKQNTVKVVKKEVKKDGEKLVSSLTVNLAGGDVAVNLQMLDNPIDGWRAVLSAVDSSGYVNFDVVHFLLDKTSPGALAEFFEYDSAKFLDLIGRVLNQKLPSSDVSEFYSMVSLLNHLNEEYMNLFRIEMSSRKYQEKTIAFFGDKTFKRQFKKVLEDSQKEQRKYLDSLFGDVEQPEIGRINYTMLKTILGAHLSERDVRRSISEFLQVDLSDKVQSEKAISVARDFTEFIFQLQFTEDPIGFLMSERGKRFFGNFFNDLIETLARNVGDLKDKNFAEIIELYLNELYGRTIATLISTKGLSDETFDYFLNAFEVFISRINKQYGNQPFISALYDILSTQEMQGVEDKLVTSSLRRLRSQLGIEGGVDKADVTAVRAQNFVQDEEGKPINRPLRIDSIQSYLGDEVYQTKYFEPFTVRRITSSSGLRVNDSALNFDELGEVAGRDVEFVDVTKLPDTAKQPVEEAETFVGVEETADEEITKQLIKQFQDEVENLKRRADVEGIRPHSVDEVSDAIVSDFLDLIFGEGDKLELKQALLSLDKATREVLAVELALSYAVRRNDLDVYYLAAVFRKKSEKELYNRELFLSITNRFFGLEKDTIQNPKDALKFWFRYLISVSDVERTKSIDALRSTLTTLGAISETNRKARDEFVLDFLRRGVEQNIEIVKKATSVKKPLDLTKDTLAVFSLEDVRLAATRSINERIFDLFTDEDLGKQIFPDIFEKIKSNQSLKSHYINFLTRFFDRFSKDPDAVITDTLKLVVKNLSSEYSLSLSPRTTRKLVREILVNWLTNPAAMINESPLAKFPSLRIYEQMKKAILDIASSEKRVAELQRVSENLSGFDSILYTLFADYIKEYLSNPKVAVSSKKEVEVFVSKVIESSASKIPFREKEKLVFDVMALDFEIYRLKEMYYSGSQEFKTLVDAVLARTVGEADKYTDKDIAEAVQEVLDFIEKGDIARFDKYNKDLIAAHKVRTMSSGKLSGVESLSKELSSGDAEAAIQRFDSHFSKLNEYWISLEGIRESSVGYVESLNNLKQTTSSLRMLLKNQDFVTVAKQDPTLWSDVTEIHELVDKTIDASLSFISTMAETTRHLFPAPLLLSRGDTNASEVVELRRVFAELYDLKTAEEVTAGIAWRDWFGRMEGVNKLFSDYFSKMESALSQLLQFQKGMSVEDLKKAVSEVRTHRVGLKKILAPPTMKQVIESMGITVEISKSWRKEQLGNVQYAMPVWKINAMPGVTTQPPINVVSLSPGTPSRLYSTLKEMFMGTVVDVSDALNLMSERSLFDYAESVFTTWDKLLKLDEVQSPLPVSSISSLQSTTDFSEIASEERRAIYQKLAANVYKFIHAKDSPAVGEAQKKVFKEIIDGLAQLYYIPTAVTRDNQVIPTYGFFVDAIKFGLEHLSNPELVNIPLKSSNRSRILQELVSQLELAKRDKNISKLDVLFAVTENLKDQINRAAVLDTIIAALNFRHLSITNQPLSSLRSLVGDDVAVVLRGRMMEVLRTQYNMTNRQARQAFQFTQSILTQLWKLHSGNLQIGEHTISSNEMWSLIFEMFSRDAGIAVNTLNLGEIAYHTPHTKPMHAKAALFEQIFRFMSLRYSNQELDNVVLHEDFLSALRNLVNNSMQVVHAKWKVGDKEFMYKFDVMSELRKTYSEDTDLNYLSKAVSDFVQTIDEILTSPEFKAEGLESVSITAKQLLDRLSLGLHPITATPTKDGYLLRVVGSVLQTGKSDADITLKATVSAEEAGDNLEFVVRLAPEKEGSEAVQVDSEIMEEIKALFGRNGFTRLDLDRVRVGDLTTTTFDLTASEQFGILDEFERSTYGVTKFIVDANSRLKAIITAFDNANVSTFLHEFYHAIEEFIPPMYRYALYDEAFRAVKKRYKLEVLKGIKDFAHFVAKFEKNATSETLLPQYIQVYKEMKEYTVSAFEALILDKTLGKEFVEEGGLDVTNAFSKEFKRILVTSYAKFRYRIADARKNKRLLNLLDNLLFKEKFDTALKLPKIEADTADSIFKTFYALLNTQQTSTTRSALRQSLNDVSRDGAFRKWNMQDVYSFFEQNDKFFSVFVQSGRIFNPESFRSIVPEGMFDNVVDMHTSLVDYALSPLILRYDLFNVKNPYLVYQSMPVTHKSLVDYLFVLFHDRSNDYFDSRILSYRISDFLSDVRSDETRFLKEFDRVKSNFSYVLRNFEILSPAKRFDLLNNIVKSRNFNFINDVDLAGIEFTTQYQKLVKKYVDDVGVENVNVQRVADDLASGHPVLQDIQKYTAEFFNPKFKTFGDKTRYWQARIYMDYLPEDMRKLVKLGTAAEVFTKGDTVIGISEVGNLRSILTSDVMTTSHLLRQAPLVYVGRRMSLDFEVDNLYSLLQIEDANDLIEFIVSQDLSKNNLSNRMFISNYITALNSVPMDKLPLIVDTYRTVSDDLISKIPPEWYETSPDIGIGLRLLEQINKTAEPDKYAKILSTVRSMAMRQMINTQFTYDRMVSLLDDISISWWHKVNAFLPSGIQQEDAVHIIRKAMAYELKGMTADEALKSSIREFLTVDWLKNNVGKIQFKLAGSDKRVTLILDTSNLVSVNDMLRSRLPDSQREIVGKTLDELKNSTLDVFYDATNKIFKPEILDMDGVLDGVSDAYLIHFASSSIPDRILRTRIEADFVTFAREVLDESNHYFVRMGDGSYLVLSKDPATQSQMSVLWRNFSSEVVGGSGGSHYPYRISIQRYSVKDLQKQADNLEQRLHNIPYHPSARVLDEPLSSFELGGMKFSVVTRDTTDPAAFVLRKTDGQGGVPVFGIADESLGESREFSSMNATVVFGELDIPYTQNDFQRLFNLCKTELGNDNVVAGIMQSWMDFASLVDADPSMSPDPAIISRLAEIYTNLLATDRFIEKRDDFIDYMLTVFALDYRGISRATLPDGAIFHFVPTDLVDVPNSKIWKAKGNAQDVLKTNTKTDLTKFKLAGMLDSDMYAGEMQKQVGKVTNTPVESRTLPLELYQAVPSNTPESNFSWSAFTNAPIFVVEQEGKVVRVSLRELMNVFAPSNFIYNGVNEFIETMTLLSGKLSEQGVEYAPFVELVNFLIRVAQEFASNKNVSLVRPIYLAENGIRVPDLNLVFDNRIWTMVSDALFAGFDLESMKTTLNSFETILRDNLSKRPVFFEMERLNDPFNPSFLVQSSDGRNILTDISERLSKNLNEMWDVINRGGTAFDGQLTVDEGALEGMNRIMIDYFSTSRADEWMKMIVPFWMYPSRSLPYWADLIMAHPELLAFYAKYREWSDSINWQDGAITSDGKILPSLEGYIPLTVGVYFNPLAPFMYRFVSPNIRDLPETRPPEEMGIFQKLARYALDIIPQYGFAVSPIVQALAMNFYEPYYPKPSFGYELVRSIIPVEWMPPLLERTLVEYTRKVTHTDMPDMWKPEVSWFDYLVEQEILSIALAKMNSATTEEEKREIAMWAKNLILDANRQENPEWKTFEDSVRNKDYSRYMIGNLTGIYTKTLSPLRVDLLQLRSEVNRMKSQINDAMKSAIFEVYDSPNDLYADYNKFRFETPEGQLYQLYQTVRYVVDPVTKRFATGEDRLKIMLQDAAAEQATQMYYRALEEENERYKQELSLLRVGDTDGRRKAREKHFENLTKIRTDPAFQDARRTKFYSPVKPKDLVYQDIYNDWWFLLVSDEPKYADYDSYDAYLRAKEEWLSNIGEAAKVLYPIFKANILSKAYAQELPEDAIQRLVDAIERVYKETSPEEYEQFRGASKTAIDVVWDAYQKLYVDPFYEALKDKTGYEYELARELYLQKNPAPDQEKIIEWIMEKYPNRFTREELENVFKQNRPYTIPEREDVTQTQIEKDAKYLLRILQNAGNLSSPTFRKFKQIYLAMGGKESDFDVLWATGGDVTRFSNPDKFYEIYNRMVLAAKEANVPEKLTIEELKERIEVQKLNDIFRMNVLRELGEDFYTLMNYYYSLSDKEQGIFRREYKEEYAKIQKYYRMRDEFSKIYPLWASYYNPNFDPAKSSFGGYSSSGGYSSGGGSYVRSTSPRNALIRVKDPSILRMGKRSSMDAMRLFLDGVLGRGGAEKAPILTEELKALIGERAAREIETGTADESTAKYLDKLSKARPDKSAELKALAQMVRRGGDLSYIRTLQKLQ